MSADIELLVIRRLKDILKHFDGGEIDRARRCLESLLLYFEKEDATR